MRSAAGTGLSAHGRRVLTYLSSGPWTRRSWQLVGSKGARPRRGAFLVLLSVGYAQAVLPRVVPAAQGRAGAARPKATTCGSLGRSPWRPSRDAYPALPLFVGRMYTYPKPLTALMRCCSSTGSPCAAGSSGCRARGKFGLFFPSTAENSISLCTARAALEQAVEELESLRVSVTTWTSWKKTCVLEVERNVLLAVNVAGRARAAEHGAQRREEFRGFSAFCTK